MGAENILRDKAGEINAVQARYVQILAVYGGYAQACMECEVPLWLVRDWEKESKPFREACRFAKMMFYESIQAAAVQRGRDGYLEDVIYKGQRCYERDPAGELILDDMYKPIPLRRRKFSDTMLDRLMNKIRTMHVENVHDAFDADLADEGVQIEFVNPGAITDDQAQEYFDESPIWNPDAEGKDPIPVVREDE